MPGPLCPYCGYDEWLAANRPDEWQRQVRLAEEERRRSRALEELARELGLPPGSPPFSTTLTHHGGEWDGFTLEMVGTDPPELVFPPPWPYWSLINDQTRNVVFLKQIWLRRVHCPDTPLVVEARWHPERPERIAVVGLEAMTNQGQYRAALNGLRLLRTLDPKGRPPGRTTLRREEFLALYDQARRECLADGLPPTDNNLLVYLPISKATLVRYRNKWLPPD